MAKGFTGPVKAVIFDWAGTVVDFGATAPLEVFAKAFEAFGVPVTPLEARVPAGLSKRAHLKAIGQVPSVAGRWLARFGHPLFESDIDELYNTCQPLYVRVAAQFADLIPGTIATVAELRSRKIKIGSTTGYTKSVMEALSQAAERNGFSPDTIVGADDLPCGRPAPLMCYQNLINLGVWPTAGAVKVDDTAPGIEEGLNAGMWTVAVAMTGSELGLREADLAALPESERQARRSRAHARLGAAGAHYVIDGVADLIPVIDDIDRRLAAGERP